MPDGKPKIRLVFGLAAVIWLALVFALYYVGHKPFSPDIVASLGRSSIHALAAFALVSVAGGLGRWILRFVSLYPLEDLALQAALGLGLLSIGFYVAGWILGLSAWLAWICLALLAILLRRSILGWWRLWSGLLTAWETAAGLGKSIAVLSVLMLAFTFFVALAPPLKFDSLVYHLALPAAYIQAGSFRFIPSNVFWGMPQLGETLYTWTMLLSGGAQALPAPACLGWAVGLIGLIGLLGSATRIFGKVGWVAVAGLMASSTVAQELQWGYVEWFTILYGWAFLAALDCWRVGRARVWLLAAGAMAGFALGSKYSAGALILVGFVVIVWSLRRHRSMKESLVGVGLFLASAIAAASPWLIKNWLATGNPLYPFLFPAAEMDAFRLSFYQGLPIWGSWRDALLLPWMATFTGYEGGPGYSASIGPLLLSLAAVYPLGRLLGIAEDTPSAGFAVPVAVAGLLIWAVAGRLAGLLIQTRLYMAFLPAFAILAAGGFHILASIKLRSVRLGRVAGSLVLLSLTLTAVQLGIQTASSNPATVILGISTTPDYLQANLGWHADAMDSINDLPASARVLMLWEPRSLYCLPRCDPDEILDRWLSDYNQYGSPQNVLEAWRRLGYTHLLYYCSGADFVRSDDARYTPEQWQALEELLISLPLLNNSGEAYSLYSLIP